MGHRISPYPWRLYSSVLLGMVNWSALERGEALEALRARSGAIEVEIARLESIQFEQQPLPDSVDVLFDYTLGQLQAEAQWLTRTLDYMKSKPWLE